MEFETAEPERAMPLSMTAEVSPPTHASEPFNAIGRMQSQFGNAAMSRGVLRALKAGRIQAKLTAGAPGDPYEQEADRVAEQIMSRTSGPVVQRKCAACEAGATCKKCSHGAPKIQTKRDAHEPIDLGSQTTAGILSLGGGQPLPTPVREKFEPQFAHDFSGVRVHTGGSAAALADDMGARAFTFEHNIVFGKGQYGPDSSDGQRLLAHELTHVVQQGAANGPNRVQADWWDDVKETAGAVVETVSTGVSVAYEAAKAAVTTLGSSASAAAPEAEKAKSDDPEKTRTNLISQVSATRQRVMSVPEPVNPSPERIQALNSNLTRFNTMTNSAVALAPTAPWVAPTIGEILAEIGMAIAALSLWEILLIVAIIALIILLIYLIFFRDTRRFPDPDTDTEPRTEPRTKPRTEPEPEPEPDPRRKPDRPPPPPIPLLRPDCCPGPTPRGSFRVTDKRHPYFKPGTVTVKDNRNKHTRNIIPTMPGTPCTAAFLLSVVNQPPNNFGPCLQAWIRAAKAGDRDYGSQMGIDTIVGYVDKVEDIVSNKSNQIDKETWKGDTGATCGVDIGVPDKPLLTDMARIAEAPHSAHIIPEV
jgi:hypothetical protein